MYQHRFNQQINLHVKEHISAEEAKRQTVTAKGLLKRLETMPGQILADEVGMGKTFVALAVAVSIALNNRGKRPIVIMVPSNITEKWKLDLNRFKHYCLPESLRDRVNCGVAKNAVQFLKYLDDPPERKKQIILLTHGSLSRSLTDGWVKLAIIQRALYRRRNLLTLKKALKKVMGSLLYMGWAENIDPDIWNKLLNNRPENWLTILQRSGIDPENDNNPDTDDDPVPEAVIDVLYQKMNSSEFDDVIKTFNQIPLRRSKYFDDRIKSARKSLNEQAKEVWKICAKEIPYKLPLLILDEAHHVKNARTRLASLFISEKSKSDTVEVSQGQLAGVFERMLFLTATPFQLGHYELCAILDRFKGINWKGGNAPQVGLENYAKRLDRLRNTLDDFQLQSSRLDQVWGNLEIKDKFIDEHFINDENYWWNNLQEAHNTTLNQKSVIDMVRSCQAIMKKTEKLLKRFVVRHINPKQFPYKNSPVDRRKRWNGNQILMERQADNEETPQGLSIEGPALLPFLLAARHSIREKNKRPVFAEGLASSYEAFLKTREANLSELVDEDDEAMGQTAHREDWYIDNLFNYVSTKSSDKSNHPKIKATVQRVMNLWEQGEKVLVFCHYIQTGKALRNYISQEMENRIIQLGSRKMKCPRNEVIERLNRIGERFYKDSSLKNTFYHNMKIILDRYGEINKEQRILIKDAVFRYLRTPSFLVRYFPLTQARFTEQTMKKALRTIGTGDESLEGFIERFVHFQARKCNYEDRKSYLEALDSVQSGYILGEDLDAEEGEVSKVKIVPNVRLVNGSTKQQARQTLMLTFNTPFFPEVMIASSVMAEGVDLHLNCRYIIHHDLCWNPSTLEQRTGRIDRIGCKGQTLGKPVCVYIPYIEETQDEKMYRVVMDRERWFKVVMGEKFKVDVSAADKIADRIPLPEAVVKSLAFDLSVYKDTGIK